MQHDPLDSLAGAASNAPKRNFTAMSQPSQAEMVAAVMMEQVGQTFNGGWPVKRRKVTEHKDQVSGGFGIRLAEAHGAEEDQSQPRIMVESLSRSKQLGAGDR
jgi:hypothetical protein